MRTHKVVAGETLEVIAARAYGSPSMWPSLYRYNNMLAVRRKRGGKPIVNPNRLQAGETIFLPELAPRTATRRIARRMMRGHGPVHRSTAVASRSVGPASPPPPPVPSAGQRLPGKPQGTPPAVRPFPPAPDGGTGEGQGGDNPAERTLLTGLAWVFELPKAIILSYEDAFIKAEFFVEGAVQLQHDKVDTALKLLATGAEADVHQQAKRVVGQLFSSAYIKADLVKRTVEFECTLTLVAAAHAPAAQLSAASDEAGRPVLRGTVQIPDVEGEFMGFIFATDRVRVGIDVKPKDRDERRPPTSAAAAVSAPAAPLARVSPTRPGSSDQDQQDQVMFFGVLAMIGVMFVAAFSN